MQIKSNPDFVVIGGPNGAGKSTISRKLLEPLNISAFDWDQRFQDKWNQLGFDPLVIEGIRESVNTEFQEHIDKAFASQEPVAYETNFHSNFNLDLAKRANDPGYNTFLYFFLLSTPELGIQRVAERVSKGGHDVSEETIRERYEAGLKMLDLYAISIYKNVLIYNSSYRFKLQLAIQERNLVYQANELEYRVLDKLYNIQKLIR